MSEIQFKPINQGYIPIFLERAPFLRPETIAALPLLQQRAGKSSATLHSSAYLAEALSKNP